MATRFIDKEFGANTSTAITDDATGRAKVRNLPDAVGFVYDSVDGFFKYNDGGTIRTLVNTNEAQTLTNITLTSPTITNPIMAVTEYLADGAIGLTSHVAVLTSTDAGAYTLATTATNGVVIDIINATSFAHVITGTNLFWAGVTGGPFNKITTAAFPGYSGRVISHGGLWLVLSSGLGVLTVGD